MVEKVITRASPGSSLVCSSFKRFNWKPKMSILKHMGIYGTSFLLDMTFGHESTRGWAVSIPSCPKLFQILRDDSNSMWLRYSYIWQTSTSCCKARVIELGFLKMLFLDFSDFSLGFFYWAPNLITAVAKLQDATTIERKVNCMTTLVQKHY